MTSTRLLALGSILSAFVVAVPSFAEPGPTPSLASATTAPAPVVRLTWALHSKRKDAKKPHVEALACTPVELRVEGLGPEQRIKLGCLRGGVYGTKQTACSGKTDAPALDAVRKPGDLAELVFQERGLRGYVAKRAPSGVELYASEPSDGKCTDVNGACARALKKVNVLTTPAGAAFDERIVWVHASGEERSYNCTH